MHRGNKGKRNMPGAAGVLAVALVVSVLVMLYLFSRGNTLATKLETVEQDAKQLRVRKQPPFSKHTHNHTHSLLSLWTLLPLLLCQTPHVTLPPLNHNHRKS